MFQKAPPKYRKTDWYLGGPIFLIIISTYIYYNRPMLALQRSTPVGKKNGRYYVFSKTEFYKGKS